MTTYRGWTRPLTRAGRAHSTMHSGKARAAAATDAYQRGNWPAAETIDEARRKMVPKTACSFAQRPNSIRDILK